MQNVLVYGGWRYFLVEKMIIAQVASTIYKRKNCSCQIGEPIPRDFISENVICGKISILSKRNRELGTSVVRESSWLVGL